MLVYLTVITSLLLEEIRFGHGNVTLLCDVSTRQPRHIALAAWRSRIFDKVQGLAHPSIGSTKALMAAKFVWHGLHKRVGKWTTACIPCQTSKIQRHTKTPLQIFTPLDRSFDHIYADIVEPLPQSRYNPHLSKYKYGRRLFLSLILPLPSEHVASSLTGLLVSVPRSTSLPRRAHNLPLDYGHQKLSCLALNYTIPRHTIQRKKALWNVFVDT